MITVEYGTSKKTGINWAVSPSGTHKISAKAFIEGVEYANTTKCCVTALAGTGNATIG
ncbi:MAG: hypothetical protein ACXQTD_00420 [Candidatus Syntropharchaeia archaeon]